MSYKNNERTGQFDLIKIISILMVLILHYMNKSMGGGLHDELSTNGILSHIIESVCIIACNLFVLITAWFMVDVRKIKLKKVFDIILIVTFYAIIIYAICILTGFIKFNTLTFKQFINTIGNRWFVSIYIILYLLIPYINRLADCISKANLKKLLIIFTIFFSIWPTFFTRVTINDNGYGIINFLYLYLIVVYIKKYMNIENIKLYKCLTVFILSTRNNNYNKLP